MHCSKCNPENKDKVNFCSSCGAKLTSGASNVLGGVGRAVGSWYGALAEGVKEGREAERPSAKANAKKDKKPQEEDN